MQRGERDHAHRERAERDRDRERLPPPPIRSSFHHGLPLPPGAGRYYPPSPSDEEWRAMSPGPAYHDMRPGSAHARRWSPPPPMPHGGHVAGVSPRFGDRLPSLADYGAHTPRMWEQPGPPPPPAGGIPPSPFLKQEYELREHGDELDPPAITVSTPREPRDGIRPQTAPAPSRPTSKHPPPAAEGEPPKKKKRRQAFSCAECSKRKQKCNRETPCQHCVSRKVPHLCVPSASARPATPPTGSNTPAARKPKTQSESGSTSTPRKTEEKTLNGRVSKLERIVNAVLNRVDGMDSSALSEWRESHGPAASPLISSATLKVEPLESRLSTSSSLSTTQRESDAAEDGWVGGLDRGTVARNPLPQSEAMPPRLDYHGTPRERLNAIVEHGGELALKMALQDLPPKETADGLVAFFFTKVNPLRYPIDERLFRQTYETVYASKGAVTPSSVLALPLIFALLAISIRLVPQEWAQAHLDDTSEADRIKLSLEYFWTSQCGINVSTSLSAESLQLVEARIILGLYLVLVHERRLAEGWLQFRAATAIGMALCLHRDGSRLGLEPYMAEYRRRLWSYLCHADATYSCLLGRPPSIDDRFHDAEPPSNIHLDDLVGLHEGADVVPRPMSEPTFATYLVLRQRLAEVVAQITAKFQDLRTPMEYADVKGIDALLCRLREGLPAVFRMEGCDKSQDANNPYLPVHRYYIQTEILHFTIILHRPWFLRQVRSDKYALSRRACFEAAITDFKIRQAFHAENPDFFETLLGGSFREFNTAMIAGINLLLEPDSSQADEMWQILSAFIARHPHNPNDDFSKKEAAIIYTLHKRATELHANSRRSSRADCDEDVPMHPLGDKTSFERSGSGKMDSRPGSAHGSVSRSSVSVDTPVVPTRSLQTPSSDDGSRSGDKVQDLFNRFLAANCSAEVGEVGAETAGLGLSTSNGVLGNGLGTKEVGLAFGPVPSKWAMVGDQRRAEVNSSKYWDTLVDVMVEQAGHA